MKKSMAVAAIVIATLTVNAQQGGGKSGGGQGSGGPGGQSGPQHQRPSPEQLAEHLMNKFDANKDSKLDQGELTQALEALRAHRPPPGGGQGAQGQDGGAALGGQGGPQHRGPGGQGGEVGGAQGSQQHRGPGGAQQGSNGEVGGGAQGGPGGQHHGLAGGGQGQQGAGPGGAKAQRPTPPPASEVAAKMIEKFAADKKGLTQAELATALSDHQKNRGPHGGPGGQRGDGPQGGGQRQGPPPSGTPANQ